MTNPVNKLTYIFEGAASFLRKVTGRQTFVEKAFEELDSLNHVLMSQTPPEVKQLLKEVHKLIDTNIDRPEIEKEALKVMSVLQMGSPFLFDDTRRFKNRYNDHLNGIVNDRIQGKETGDLTQVDYAMGLAMGNQILKLLQDPSRRSEMLAEISAEGTYQEAVEQLNESLTTADKNHELAAAPRLMERFKLMVTAQREIISQYANSAPTPSVPNSP